MKYIGLGITWAALLCGCASSGGTETDNPARGLTSFNSSNCKSKAPASQATQARALEPYLDGLQCVQWDRQASGALALRLLNFPEGCTTKYEGRASLTGESELALSVYTETCAVAACGSCLFDFDFEVEGVSDQAPLVLRTGSAICENDPVEWESQLSLPVHQEPSGLVCRQLAAGALSWYALRSERCGERNMPCGDCDSSTADDLSCAAELSCTTLGEHDSRCLANCVTDADCGASATTCQSGVCRADADW